MLDNQVNHEFIIILANQTRSCVPLKFASITTTIDPDIFPLQICPRKWLAIKHIQG